MLDVKRLLLLRDLAEYGTVTAVAEAHRVTSSAVSQQLKHLESQTGAALLHREGRAVRLTAAGRELVAGTEEIVAALERTAARLRALTQEPAGPLGVSCFTSALPPLVAPLLRALRSAHPAIEPVVTEAEPEASLTALRHGRTDLAVVYRYAHLGTPMPRWAEATELLVDPLLAVVPADHPALGRGPAGPVALGDLADEDWITAPTGSACRDATVAACRNAGYTPRVRHACADFGAVLALAAAGGGVALVPRLAAGTMPPGLVARPFGVPSAVRTVEALVRRGTADRPAVAACLAALVSGAGALRVTPA